MQQLMVSKYNFDERKDFGGILLSRGEEKVLAIDYAPNLDLYFSLENFEGNPEFIIGKDNYQVYSIFDKLYHDVINANVYKFSEDEINDIIMYADIEDKDYHETLKQRKERKDEANRELKKRDAYKRLVNNGIITWRSDDFPLEVAPFFSIQKLPNAYLISFGVPEVKEDIDPYCEMMLNRLASQFEISVRLRNSGSSFEPFNHLFMVAYNELLEIGEYHQIHMEEYLISKRIEKGESLQRILTK